MTNPLTATVRLDGIAIRQDDQGRFCLNDLHRAAGKEQRHKPVHWLDNEQTKRLIDECAKSLIQSEVGISTSFENKSLAPVVVLKGGNGPQGTYVIRELVYAYAMWISPAFHLRAIRFLDAALRSPATPQPDHDCARLLQLTRAALLEVAPQLELVARCANAGLTNAQIARAAGTSQRRVERLKARLRRLGLLPEACVMPGQLDLFAEVSHA